MRLPELRTKDLKALSRFVSQMSLCDDIAALESFVLSELTTLVDGDVAVWNEVTLGGNIVCGSTWPQFDEKFWTSLAPALVANLADHPFVREISKSRPEFHANRISDYSTYRHFLRTPLRNEIYSEWNCEYMCISSFDTGRSSQLAFQINRSDSNFTKGDVQKFWLLAKQAKAIYQRISVLEKLEQNYRAILSDSSIRTFTSLRLGPFLTVRSASQNAQELLYEDSGKHRVGFSLPEKILNRLKSIAVAWDREKRDFSERSCEFKHFIRHRKFSFRFRQCDFGDYRLEGLVEAGDRRLAEKSMLANAEELNRRELNVLSWVASGKTNPEIAILMNLKVKTIEGYVSSILDKLDLSDRTQLILSSKILRAEIRPA